MANKERLNKITQISNNEEAAVALFNENVDKVNRAIEDSLSRSGKGVNNMTDNLDMGDKAIINLKMRSIEARKDGDVVVWGEIKDFTGASKKAEDAAEKAEAWKNEAIKAADFSSNRAKDSEDFSEVSKAWAVADDFDDRLEGESSSKAYSNLAMAIANAPEDVPVNMSELQSRTILKGDSATLKIANVSTLPAGQEAYIRNIGTERDAVFEIGLPRAEDDHYAQGNLGDIRSTASRVPPKGCAWCDGAWYSQSQYPDMYEAVRTKQVAVTTASEYSAMMTNRGVCSFFLLDEAGKRFRVPTLKENIMFSVAMSPESTYGIYRYAGLPNITGEAATGGEYWVGNKAFDKGALELIESTTGTRNNGGDGGRISLVRLNASRSSPVYGRSNTVQPEAVQMNYYVVLAENRKSIYTPKQSVATFAELPATGNVLGDTRVALDTGIMYVWAQTLKGSYTWSSLGSAAPSGGVSLAEWGSISGDITQQADLQEALAKAGRKDFRAGNGISIEEEPLGAVNNGFTSVGVTLDKNGIVTKTSGTVKAFRLDEPIQKPIEKAGDVFTVTTGFTMGEGETITGSGNSLMTGSLVLMQMPSGFSFRTLVSPNITVPASNITSKFVGGHTYTLTATLECLEVTAEGLNTRATVIINDLTTGASESFTADKVLTSVNAFSLFGVSQILTSNGTVDASMMSVNGIRVFVKENPQTVISMEDVDSYVKAEDLEAYALKADVTGYKSLDEAQKTQLLLDGTYKGADIVDGEVFTEYDGKFVEFDKVYNESTEWVSRTQTDFSMDEISSTSSSLLAEGNGRLVLISGNSSFVSLDGINWTKYTINSSHYNYRFVVFNGSEFVAWNGSYNYIAKSTDGMNWTEYQRVNFSNLISYFEYTGTEYVALSMSGTYGFYTSPDAITWTLKSDIGSLGNTNYHFSMCTKGPDKYVCMNSIGQIIYSTDLVSWTLMDSAIPALVGGSGNSGYGITYANGLYNAVFSSSSSSWCWTAWSEDGITWTKGTRDGAYGNWTNIKYLGDKWYIIAQNKKISVSEDGKHFTDFSGELPTDTSYSYLSGLFYGKDKLLLFMTNSIGQAQFSSYKAFVPFYEYSLLPLSYTKDEVESAGFLKNTATGSESLTIAGTASTYTQSLNIGPSSSITGNYGMAVGRGATAANNSTALGYNAKAQGTTSVAVGKQANAYGRESVAIGAGGVSTYSPHSVAIGYMAGCGGSSSDSYEGATALGYYAKARAAYATQIGYGTNSTANTFNVGLSSSLNVQLLDANGNIPAERLGFAPNGGAPSENYVGLALATSGEDYTAPADGFMMLSKVASAAGQYINLANQNAAAMISQQYATAASQILRVFLPVQKGDTIKANFSAGGELKVYRFIYAKGAV